MFLDSIEYTATLIELVSRQTCMTVAAVTKKIGKERIYNLCHNAPMNRVLPIKRIGMEVISDNFIPVGSLETLVEPDWSFGKSIGAKVFQMTDDQKKYVDVLFALLQKEG